MILSNPGRSPLGNRAARLIRLPVYVAIVPVFATFDVKTSAVIVALTALATVVYELLARKTIWLRLHVITLGLFAFQLVYAAVRLYFDPGDFLTDTAVLTGICMIWLALSSDAVSCKSHWAWLVGAWLIVMAITVALPGHTQVARLYVPTAIIAATSRLFFPPADQLLHTSLDYWFGRVEIISLGMKQALAVGLKRKS